MLARHDLADLDLIAAIERRDGGEVVHRLPLLRLVPLHIERVIPVEDHDRPGRPEQVAAQIEVHDRNVVDRRRHLRRHEPLPDKLVQPELVGLEIALDVFRPVAHVGRPDGFVRLLGAHILLGGVCVGGVGKVVLGVVPLDERAHRRDRGVGDADGVGSHVGDQTDGALVTDVDALVQVLGRAHGAARGEAEALGGFLLQGARGERRRRPLAALLPLHVADHERDCPHGIHHGAGLGLGMQLGLVAVDLVE